MNTEEDIFNKMNEKDINKNLPVPSSSKSFANSSPLANINPLPLSNYKDTSYNINLSKSSTHTNTKADQGGEAPPGEGPGGDINNALRLRYPGRIWDEGSDHYVNRLQPAFRGQGDHFCDSGGKDTPEDKSPPESAILEPREGVFIFDHPPAQKYEISPSRVVTIKRDTSTSKKIEAQYKQALWKFYRDNIPREMMTDKELRENLKKHTLEYIETIRQKYKADRGVKKEDGTFIMSSPDRWLIYHISENRKAGTEPYRYGDSEAKANSIVACIKKKIALAKKRENEFRKLTEIVRPAIARYMQKDPESYQEAVHRANQSFLTGTELEFELYRIINLFQEGIKFIPPTRSILERYQQEIQKNT